MTPFVETGPDGELTVRYTDSAGRTSEVARSAPGGGSTILTADYTYYTNGQVQTITYGNGAFHFQGTAVRKPSAPAEIAASSSGRRPLLISVLGFRPASPRPPRETARRLYSAPPSARRRR